MAKYTAAEIENMGLSGGLPRHVAIIMDGNGRWAKQRGLPRALGHRAGTDRLRGLIKISSDLGIEALSLYAFSTENWRRPQEEIGALFALLVEYFEKEIDELHANAVQIRALGDLSKFPNNVANAVRAAMLRTRENTGLRLNIALNYGGRDDLRRAFSKLLTKAEAGELAPVDITEETIESALDTAGLPPVDFLIRTGGEERLSNFLLFQAAYAELLFVPDYFPDFSDERYVETLRIFQSRSRRYGGL